MFWGSFDHVLDDKGRTSLPQGFREALEELSGEAWMTGGLPDCVQILPAHRFEAVYERLTSDDFAGLDDTQHLQRLILGMATRCTVDRQNRIAIPPHLRRWAGLQKEIVFTGVGHRIEIWDRERHLSELEQTRVHFPRYSRILREQGD